MADPQIVERQEFGVPRVGDYADHVSREVDPRPVVAVSESGLLIRLRIGSLLTDWLPAEQYTYSRPCTCVWDCAHQGCDCPRHNQRIERGGAS